LTRPVLEASAGQDVDPAWFGGGVFPKTKAVALLLMKVLL